LLSIKLILIVILEPYRTGFDHCPLMLQIQTLTIKQTPHEHLCS